MTAVHPFKVGDKVKCVKGSASGTPNRLAAGAVYTVESVNHWDNSTPMVRVEGVTALVREGWYASRFKAVATADADAVDVVNNPPHYTAHPSGVECIHITQHMNFCRGNAVKYIWRAGEKDKTKEVEDLRKAIFYLKTEIERMEKTTA